jgi:hypothetical protein
MTAPDSQDLSRDRVRTYLRTAIEDATNEPVTEADVARIRFIQKLARDLDLGGNWAVNLGDGVVMPQ